MKKSLLALAILTPVLSANAANVYDSNGTQLSVGGRVQSVFFSANSSKAGEKDSSLVNSARFNLSGQTKVNDFISALAFTEWDLADGHKKNVGDNIKSREQYVGAQFSKYGKLIAGKTFDSTRALSLSTDTLETLDIYNDTGLNGDRRNGVVRYDYDNNNIFLSASFQIASDEQVIFGKKRDLESGYSLTAGYTFDDVFFGPLSIKAGYNYLKGQDDDVSSNVYENSTKLGNYSILDKADNYGLSVTLGSLVDGPYIGAHAYRQNSYFEPVSVQNSGVESYKLRDLKHVRSGYELLGGYNFENGISVYAGYEVQKQKISAHNTQNSEFTYKRIPVQVKYTYLGVKLWVEAEFDAGSDKKEKYKNISPVYNGEFTPYSNHTQFTVGARYTF